MSINVEKTFDKIQRPFMIENTQQNRNKGNIFQRKKGHYEKPTANIILNGQKLKSFPLRSETRQVFHFYLSYSTQYWKFYPRQSDKKRK